MSEICKLRTFVMLLTSLAVCRSLQADPCLNHKVIDNPYRSTGYVTQPGDSTICDEDLEVGWYKFINEVGGNLPEHIVDPNHCGTVAPIWMRGLHPSVADDVVDRVACVNYNGFFQGCLTAIPIKVKNCSNYYVYYLRPPHGCAMGYCAGTRVPCPKGQSGLFPDCRVSQKLDFPFALVPVPSISYDDDGEVMVTLTCSFNFSLWTNVSFEIQSFVNGKGSVPSRICDYDESGGPCTTRSVRIRNFHPGDQVRCEVRARYNTHQENNWTQPVSSKLFFVGIKVRPRQLDIDECRMQNDGMYTFQLQPTVPIRTVRTRDPDTIKVNFGSLNPGGYLSSTCSFTLGHSDVGKWKNITVQAVCDDRDEAAQEASFTFSVVDTNMFWLGYNLPPVVLRKRETSVNLCQATGDPHYTTFDSRNYDFYRPGDYVLYRNLERFFEVHTRLWICWGRTCDCGVAIREHNDVIVLDTCTEDLQMRYGMPMKIRIPSNRRLQKGTEILARHPGGYSEYEVRLPSGTRVKIQRYHWGNNIYLYAPQSDFSSTEGMCGNFNGNPNDDFLGGDGETHTDQDAFGQSWRVNKSQSLFHIVPMCDDPECDGSIFDMDFCTCNESNGVTKVQCGQPISQPTATTQNPPFQPVPQTGLSNDEGKRSVEYSDDVIYHYDNIETPISFHMPRKKRNVDLKMSLENATDYCEKALLNMDAVRVCMELTNVNVSGTIHQCASDLQITGDVFWVESAFESLKSSCQFEAVKNYSAYEKDEEGNLVPPQKITKRLCPNDCSFQGNCTNGICVCNEGFVAADCSMRYDEIPRLFRPLDEGLCDIRARPCMRTIVFGDYFLSSENLTCHVKEFKVVPSTWEPINVTQKFNGSKTDLFAVECNLPSPPINLGNYQVEGTPAARYLVSVSNDGDHESEPVQIMTFDSVCQVCNVSNGCSLKDDSCLIRGHCFAKDGPNPDDWCQQCIPSASQHNWTRRVVNLPPNITTPSVRYALIGENLRLQLEGEDPENRPFVVKMIGESPSLASFNDINVLHWRPESLNSTRFYFKASDECNASSTFNMTIEVLTCPCTDKGTCVPDPSHPRGSGMYYCECQPGYEGQTCEKEINECLQSPCLHGNCIDAVNNYSCQCLPGYTGYNCTIDINECQSSPCVHGSCIDMVNGFNCSCQSGFSGNRCEENIDDCPSFGCGNGTCIDLVDNYTCQCNAGFAGQHCEVIVRNCSDDSCFQGVLCIQKTHTISCGPCPNGFTGDGKTCIDIDDCVNHSCNNSGTCVDGLNNYTCNCLEGYTGDDCEIDINECLNHTCLNGASCVDGINNYTCDCAPGFSGDLCGTNIDDCVNHKCNVTGGSCKDGVNNYSCICLAGFTGNRCERDIDDCTNHTCANGGTCVDGTNNFSCRCPPGFTGERCETDINECVNHTCLNGAPCIDSINSYRCSCVPGFTGDLCGTNIDECVNHTCVNDATCVDGINKYMCNCAPGFTGDLCGTNIDDCIDHSCANGGSCVDGVNNYSCSCIEGFTGDRCKTDIDDCVNHECNVTGGSCEDGVNNYSCICLTGFTGSYCETDIDDCVNHTCNVIGGSCKDGQSNYSCICLVGFTGDHCETNMDDCANHTCANGATCVDGSNNFSCNCLPGYSGERCETAITMNSTHVSMLNPYVTTSGMSSTSAKGGVYSTHVVINAITESSTLHKIRTTSAIKDSVASSSVIRDIPTTEARPNTITTSPTTSESQKTVFAVEMRIERTWNEDLKDTTSSAFNELASVVETEVKKQYSGVKNFIGVKIIAFRSGSIVAEFKLLFNQKVSDDTAVAPLKKAVKKGNLGPLIVNPDSVKLMKEDEDPTNDVKEKLPYPIIIGVSCGGIFVIVLVSICLVRHCQRQKRLRCRRVSNGIPFEVPFPNQEKYELKKAQSKEDIVNYEELGLWEDAGNDEKFNGVARYQEVGIANMASENLDIGKLNESGYHQRIGMARDPERSQQIGIILKKAGK